MAANKRKRDSDPEKTIHESNDEHTTESVDKIRDLIFGSQMQDYERKFSRLEARFLSQITELKEETKKWYDTLEKYVKKELESISERLQNEKNDRINSHQKTEKKHHETETSIQTALQNLSEQTIKNEKELRQQLLDHSKLLRTEIQKTHDDIIHKLDLAVEELRDEKTDRKSLANMLVELAMKLNTEFEINGMGKVKDE